MQRNEREKEKAANQVTHSVQSSSVAWNDARDRVAGLSISWFRSHCHLARQEPWDFVEVNQRVVAWFKRGEIKLYFCSCCVHGNTESISPRHITLTGWTVNVANFFPISINSVSCHWGAVWCACVVYGHWQPRNQESSILRSVFDLDINRRVGEAFQQRYA